MADRSSPRGRLEILPAKALTRIKRFQRTPKPNRLNQLRKMWDDDKVGCLHVARIIDGEYKGKLHIYNGGTRWEVKKDDDPDYLFDCYVRDMTGKHAAKMFLSESQDSMKPSAFARFRVGTAAGEPVALAIQAALASIPLTADEGRSVYGNGAEGLFSAFAAAERIVKRAYALSENWDEASAHLAWAIRSGRAAYPQHGDNGSAYGHDADVIQALSAAALRNPRILTENGLDRKLISAVNTYYAGDHKLDRLFDDRQTMKPEHWRTAFVATRGNMGGSESRGVQIQKLIIRNFHRGNPSIKLRVEA
jgi:hypothetical protein